MSASASGVAELGTILGVWAHSDDEAYLSGGRLISTISPVRARDRERSPSRLVATQASTSC